MSSIGDLDRLLFCLEKIQDLEEYLSRYPDSEGLVNDKMALDAVLMCVLQIGESLNGIKDPEIASRLPVRGVSGMRNIIAHQYRIVSPTLVTKSLQEELPDLKKAVKQIVAEFPKAPS